MILVIFIIYHILYSIKYGISNEIYLSYPFFYIPLHGYDILCPKHPSPVGLINYLQ